MSIKLQNSKYRINILNIFYVMSYLIKFKTKKYHTVGTVPISNRKIVERDKSDNLIHFDSRYEIGTRSSIKTGEIRLVL